MAANESEHRRWNDEVWLEGWLRREALTAPVTGDLLGHLAPAPGQRVLDIGAGGGGTTLAIGAAVEPGGEVLGVDISEHLVDLSRKRAAAAGIANARFVLADAQVEDFAEGTFDAATSQFGVMFFDQPVQAFANIRAHVRPGGRLAFACWQPVDRNPWFAGQAVAALVGPPPPPLPGAQLTGPFTLADHGRVTDLLTEAGWSDVAITQYERTTVVERDVLGDDAQLAFYGVPVDRLDEARAAVEAHLSPLARADGRYTASLAYQVVTATA